MALLLFNSKTEMALFTFILCVNSFKIVFKILTYLTQLIPQCSFQAALLFLRNVGNCVLCLCLLESGQKGDCFRSSQCREAAAKSVCSDYFSISVFSCLFMDTGHDTCHIKFFKGRRERGGQRHRLASAVFSDDRVSYLGAVCPEPCQQCGSTGLRSCLQIQLQSVTRDLTGC